MLLNWDCFLWLISKRSWKDRCKSGWSKVVWALLQRTSIATAAFYLRFSAALDMVNCTPIKSWYHGPVLLHLPACFHPYLSNCNVEYPAILPRLILYLCFWCLLGMHPGASSYFFPLCSIWTTSSQNMVLVLTCRPTPPNLILLPYLFTVHYRYVIRLLVWNHQTCS